MPGALVPGLAQQFDVLGQDEGSRDEAELLLAEANLHLGHVPPEPVLPADLERSREVIQLRGGSRQTQRRRSEFSSWELVVLSSGSSSRQQQQRRHSYLLVFCNGLEAGGLHMVAPAAQPVVTLYSEKQK